MPGRKKVITVLLAVITQSAFALECDLKSQQNIGQEILDEIERAPFACTKQNIHLTFDDGPSPESTPKILSELNKRGIKASFFITTTNLKSRHAEENAQIIREELKSGHLVADHGHEHNAYDMRMAKDGSVMEKGYNQMERDFQIKTSLDLLDSATGGKFSKQPLKLFRFPYGRGAMPSAQELESMQQKGQMKFTSSDYGTRLTEYRKQSPALQSVAGLGFSHLGWNHDSHDSSFGTDIEDKAVLKKYILSNIKNLCQAKLTQVALFHDIKIFNAVAIPVIADIGKCLGLKFITAQEMNAEQDLVKSGVLIKKETFPGGPVDLIGNLLSKIEKGHPQVDCQEDAKKGCFSEQYQKYYKDCEGGDSICLGGRWYSRRDPIVIMNCNIND